jgi:hypothetical protein
VKNPHLVPTRSAIGSDPMLRLDGSMTAGGAAREQLVIECTTTRRAARKRLALARSQQFDRPLVALWCTNGVRADRRRFAGKSRIPQGIGASRPPYCGKKSARGSPVGWIERIGISAPWGEVHFASQPAFSDNERKIKGWRTSRAMAWSMSVFRAGRSVAPRVIRLFGSALVSWHTAAMACPSNPPISHGQPA